MKIIPPHRVKSKKVNNYKEIKEEVKGIIRLLAEKDFIGKYEDAYAIHHSQVSEQPYNFFVLNFSLVKSSIFPSNVIINPVIWGYDGKYFVKEGCMSYPFRGIKKVRRFSSIKVFYQVKAWIGLKKIEQQIDGLEAQIFQHEIDHGNAIYVY